MDLEPLISTFQNYNLHRLKSYADKLSSKTTEGTYFKPYIPLVGKNYTDHKIIVYGTAQNLPFQGDIIDRYTEHSEKLVERLYYSWGFERKYPMGKLNFGDIPIAPYFKGVLPALLGILLYAKYHVKLNDLNQIHDHIAVSNYYKFSLRKKNQDLNPNLLKNPQNYWELNDELVDCETGFLKPASIITFKGRHFDRLRNKFNTIPINDPAWILRGGGGTFKPSGGWARYTSDIEDDFALQLIEHYVESLTDRYAAKRESVKIYLKKYYKDWAN